MNNSTNQLIDVFEKEAPFKIASKSSRFRNHIADSICFVFILFLHAMLFDSVLGIIPEEGSPLLALYFLILYIGYFTLFEYFFSKTPGKFITNTHVVTVKNNRPSFLNLLGRNICRLIPLDNISYLIAKRGLHDEFSKTMVVQDN